MGGKFRSGGRSSQLRRLNPRVEPADACFARRPLHRTDIALAPGGRVAWYTKKETLVAVDIDSNRVVRRIRAPSLIKAFALVPERNAVAYTCAGKTVHLFDLDTELIRSQAIDAHYSSGYVAPLPNGRLVTGHEFFALDVWTNDGLEPVSSVRGMANFSRPRIVEHAGATLVVAEGIQEHLGRVTVWNLDNGELVAVVGSDWQRGFAVGDGELIVLERVVEKHKLVMRRYDIMTGTCRGEIDTGGDESSFQQTVLLGTDPTGASALVQRAGAMDIYDLAAGVLSMRLPGAARNGQHRFVDSGRLIASSGRDLCIWDLSARRSKPATPSQPAPDDDVRPIAVLGVGIFPVRLELDRGSGRVLALNDRGGTVGSYELTAFAVELAVAAGGDNPRRIGASLAYIDHDVLIGLLDNRAVARWDLAVSAKPVAIVSLERWTNVLTCIPGTDAVLVGNPLARTATSLDRPPVQLSECTENCLHQLESVALDATGTLGVATWDDGRAAQVFDVATGRAGATVSTRAGATSGVTAAAFAGGAVVIGTGAGHLTLVDCATGQELCALGKHPGAVAGIYSVDSTIVLSVCGAVVMRSDAVKYETLAKARHKAGTTPVIACSPDLRLFVIVGESSRIEVRRMDDLSLVATMQARFGVTGVAFGPRGRIALADRSGDIALLELSNPGPHDL